MDQKEPSKNAQKEPSQKDSAQTKSGSTLFAIAKFLSFMAFLFAGGVAISCLFDDTRDLPHMEAYKEEYNSDLRLSTICVKGYRYLVYDYAPRYAVQVWENGPDGPRLSQCPRTPDKD